MNIYTDKILCAPVCDVIRNHHSRRRFGVGVFVSDSV